MPDLGSRYPIQHYGEIKETKVRKLLWLEAKINEHRGKIAAFKHNIDGEEQLLNQALEQKKLLEQSQE